MSDTALSKRFVFLGSPIAWALYFTAVYLLIEAACKIGLLRGSVVGLTFFLMLPTLAVILYTGYLSWQTLQTTPHPEPVSEANMAETNYFIAQVSLWSSALFVILTLAVAVTGVVLQPC